jgi:hypothetical protein
MAEWLCAAAFIASGKERTCLVAENGGFFELSTAAALSWLRSTTRLFVLVELLACAVNKRRVFRRPAGGEARAAA